MTGLQIAGLGHYLPARTVSNLELSGLCARTPEWILARTGVLERHWVEGEGAAQMGAAAAREAVTRSGLPWEAIDLIVNASGTPIQALPDGAALLQSQLPEVRSGVACFSIHATCLSFLVALQVVAGLLACQSYRHVLIVSSEVTSGSLNFGQPESASLFGDGAAAALVRATPAGESSTLSDFTLETYSQGVHFTEVRGGGSARHPLHPDCTREDNLFSMDGPAVLRLARTHLPPFLERLCPGLCSGLGAFDLVVPHQASKAGLDLLDRFDWPRERVVSHLGRVGNTVAASIPLGLYLAEREGRLTRGMRVLLLGTGAGFSIGGARLTY